MDDRNTRPPQNDKERERLIDALTTSRTGLPTKRLNNLKRLLKGITCSSFAEDGASTNAKMASLTRKLGRNRRTLQRWFKMAEHLDIIKSFKRFGDAGQQIGSKRCVDWSVVRNLTKGNYHPNADDAHPRVTCRSGATDDRPGATDDRPGATDDVPGASSVAPYSPNSPDQPKQSIRSRGPEIKMIDSDVRKRHGRKIHVHAPEIGREVARLFDAIGYAGDNGQTLWLAIAVMHAGLLSRNVLERAISAVRHTSKTVTSPCGFFRTALAEKAGLSKSELAELFKRVHITGGLPQTRPQPARIDPTIQAIKRPPPSGNDAATMNERRNDIANKLRQTG